ncbi:MAG TPA: hypothetical protein EYP09_02130, partial [Anaerolineae bacterium]|nr:hypothetical protein [Anaerolineae bacterium]
MTGRRLGKDPDKAKSSPPSASSSPDYEKLLMAAGYITIGALYLIAIISGWGSLPTSSLLLLTGLMGAFTLGHRFAPEPEEFE